MTDKQRMNKVVDRLKAAVRNDCALEYEGDPWKLAVMARLSAQCTDARVNAVSRELFAKFPTAGAMAEGDIAQIEELVRPCGLFRTKASSIKQMSNIIVSEYSGEIPSTMDELLALPGVGRKIANLIRGDLFGLGGIVADTHCIRICGRLGFYPETEKDPTKVEKILTPLVALDEQTDFCHRIVWFGREVCSARAPRCEECILGDLCKHNKKKK